MKPLQPILDMLEHADDPRSKAVTVCKKSRDEAKEKQENDWGGALEAMSRQIVLQNAYNQQLAAANSSMNRSLSPFGSILGGLR